MGGQEGAWKKKEQLGRKMYEFIVLQSQYLRSSSSSESERSARRSASSPCPDFGRVTFRRVQQSFHSSIVCWFFRVDDVFRAGDPVTLLNIRPRYSQLVL